MFKIEDILEWTNGKIINKCSTKFEQIEVDTRKLKQNSLFITTKGRNIDTNNLICEAIERGATGVIFSDKNKYDIACNNIKVDFTAVKINSNNIYESFGMIAKEKLKTTSSEVIGVTGTAGKSTTTKLLNHFLNHKYCSISTKENNGIEGVGEVILQNDVEPRFVVIELAVAAQKNEGLPFTLDMVKSNMRMGIITNISENHTCIDGGFKEVIRRKSEVITLLGEDDIGILNADDYHTEEIIKKSKCRIVSFGILNKADIMAEDIEVKESYTEFTIVNSNENKKQRVKSPIIGRHNVYNVLAAVACLANRGFELEEIKEYLESFEPIEMRMQNIILKSGVRFINDSYNCSPVSMKGAIDTLNSFKKRRKILVLADMAELGEITEEVHLNMAKYIANKMPHILITFGENSKVIHQYLSQLRFKNTSMHHCENIQDVIDTLSSMIQENDTIVLKGSRSMMLERVIDYFKC